MPRKSAKKISARDRQELLATLKERFQENPNRHPKISWEAVEARLEDAPAEKLWSLQQMEATGGEPDVTGKDGKTGEILFMDCAPQSPDGRRSLCYDRPALEARKKHKPDGSAVEAAAAMGAELLDEKEYRRLQALGPVDTRTSSWLTTPEAIRELGGAIFGDYRYGTVFIYHNGADSYYAARGFRCLLRV